MPTLNFTLSCPLPPGLPPHRVLQALHRYETLITPNPYLVSYRRRPVDLREIVDDAFFREDGHALAAFEVVDRIVLVPGLATKQVVIPCVMQRFEGGLRCRSLAAGGVCVRSTWRVVPVGGGAALTLAGAASIALAPASRSSSEKTTAKTPAATTASASQAPTPPPTPPKDDVYVSHSSSDTTTAYELVEEATVECGSLVKPFVGRSFQSSHLQILRKVLGDIMQQS